MRIFLPLCMVYSFHFPCFISCKLQSLVAYWPRRCQIVYARYLQASAQRMAAFNLPTFEDWKARVEEESAGEGKLEGEGMVQNLSMMVFFLNHRHTIRYAFLNVHLLFICPGVHMNRKHIKYSLKIQGLKLRQRL